MRSPPENVGQLLRRAAEGCEESAAEFVRRYERQIRLEIRTRLAAAGLYVLVDSMDVAQQTFYAMLMGLRQNRYQFDSPEQAISLLSAIAEKKTLETIRYHRAHKRDVRRTWRDVVVDGFESPEIDPHSRLEHQETIASLRRRLGEGDFELLRLRFDGCSWEEIGARQQMTPNAARMRFHRILSRLT